MNSNSRILVCGASGLVGSAIIRALSRAGFQEISKPSRGELDLTDRFAVQRYFEQLHPEYVFMAAGVVGGILANSNYPADFIRDNLAMELNVIDCAWRVGAKKLLNLGSSCIYPRETPQPIREDFLLSGPLEPTNAAYAVAKIAGVTLCQSYARQFGSNFISAMPTNLYGPGDNFDLEWCHVLPALLRKFHEAKIRNSPSVVVWGSGRPRREFLFVDDLADACLFLMKHYNDPSPINVGLGEDIEIAELALLIGEVVGFQGALQFDPAKPDGMPRKLLDVSKINALGWKARTPLQEGLSRTYSWYVRQEQLGTLPRGKLREPAHVPV
jgi:GDP-L-fucose synthase